LAEEPAPRLEAPAAEASPAQVLLGRIAEAKKLLRTAPIGTDRIGGENAVLAVWSPVAAGKIALVTVRGGIARTKGFTVSLERRNGVNSLYKVLKPEGYVVLALKTNVKNRSGGRGRSRTAVYVPYSPDLDLPEIAEAGRDYLVALVDKAADTLDDREVGSLHDAEARVTETVPERILLTILVIEHMTPSEFDAEGVEATAGRVLATVGLNGEDSYDFAVSSARAGGLAQFIAETYKLTRGRYPKAKLERDFVAGMRDHRNAVMAQYCLADWSIGKLPDEARRLLTDGSHEEDLGAYVAAAYNGGEERAAKAYATDPANWEKEGYGLAAQTVTYVREFRAVYRHLFAAPAPDPVPQTPEP
jgi:hypothetical protein